MKPYLIGFINILPDSILKPLSRFAVRRLIGRYADLTIVNKEVLDKINGPVVFVSNHLSNSDGPLLSVILKEKKPYFVAGIKLTNYSIGRIGFAAIDTIPIKPNSADIEAIKRCIEVIKEGSSVFIFPEGTRSRTEELMEGKKGIVLIAKKCGVPIVPIGIHGSEKLMPINDSNLGHEAFNHAKVTVTFGDPFELPERCDSNKDEYNQNCIDIIMKNIAALLPEKYRGVYK